MTITPEEIEMNERKALLNKITIDSKHNEEIDIEKVLDVYQAFAIELEIYKYSGLPQRFHTALIDELSTNAHGLKSFLEQVLIEYQITIYQYLILKIK